MAVLWGIIGAILCLILFKSIFGLFFGFVAGTMLFNMLQQNKVPQKATLFLEVVFEVLGHLSKAKGVVTQVDIDIATRFMAQLQLDNNGRKLAQESFNSGKKHDYPLRKRLNKLYLQYRLRKNVLNTFCEQLILAALSDGQLHEKEQQILFIVADELHISRTDMARFIQMLQGSYYYRQSGGQQHYQYSNSKQNHYYKQSSYQNSSTQYSDINNAYRILGVSSSDDPTTIKRAYRKLMNQHHPDKLVSKGLPKEMQEAAKKRVQEIQSAYDLIKSNRNFK